MNLRMLTALRMNATYPYILPSVWLPSHPVIDVMDAGLRDNSGQETSLRFLNVFKDWINKNTRWRFDYPGSCQDKKEAGMRIIKMADISEIITKPFTMLQTNWFQLQDYFQDDEISYAKSFLTAHSPRCFYVYS